MILVWLFGCAVKSGVTMIQMEKSYEEYNTPENRQAEFEWAMAENYMSKAKEEYASSQYQDAEILAKEAVSWMEKAVNGTTATSSQQSEERTQ